jgi:hypothetical protein
MRFLLSALLTLLLAALPGCGKRWGDLERLDTSAPRLDTRELNTARALLANVELLNTYDAFEDGRQTGQLARTVIPWDMETRTWRNYESDGSYVELREIPGQGLAVTTAHNRSFDSWIVFDEPVVFAPGIMTIEEPAITEGRFETWAKGWSRRRGSLSVTSRYVGIEDVTVPLGRVSDCARVDATFDVKLPFAFNITMNQRQWLHPEYGEVLRDIDGSFGWAGVGVSGFTRRYTLVSSTELDAMTRQDMISKSPVEVPE